MNVETGGSVKAEGLGDGAWADHRQAALDAATQNSTSWDKHNAFVPDHRQASLDDATRKWLRVDSQ